MKSSTNLPEVDGCILIGRVSGAHGIRGDLKVQSHADSMDLYAPGKPLELVLEDGTRRTVKVLLSRPHGPAVRLHLESVDTRTQAEALAGAFVFVDKNRLPVLDEDDYYWFQLIGLKVYNMANQLLGNLSAIIPTPGNDVYVVHGEVDGNPREMLIPAVGAVVREIDLENGIMRVDPPEGL
ncbi:ribosome maturation factor RimM [Desulfosarcina sp. OttesenSCG-928-G17]|nr:ribosome maturation factor RimM [Desulfosarcina sp. OttesenSCG-928-G17]